MNDTTGLLHHLVAGRAPWLFRDSRYWEAFGLLGTFLFGSRFVIQWLWSERHKRIVVPPVFWHLSFWGSIILLLYGLHLDRLPIILGYFFLPFLYARNLMLLRRTPPEPAVGA